VVDAAEAALIAELAKKSGVCWVGVDGQTHPVWHVWLDDAMYVVSGGTEQPLPRLEDATVTVTLRSRDGGGRLVTWPAAVSRLTRDDPDWVSITTALVAARLNLPDPATAAEGWASGSVVHRLQPAGDLVEGPGALSDESHAAPPVATPATTRGRLPRVLHRRVRRRPKLS
jgi:hypothetical protein